jgi:hypothetical protein
VGSFFRTVRARPRAGARSVTVFALSGTAVAAGGTATGGAAPTGDGALAAGLGPGALLALLLAAG